MQISAQKNPGKICQSVMMLILFFIISSCATPETLYRDEIAEYDISPSELKGLQMYVSDEIIYRSEERVTEKETRSVRDGRGKFGRTKERRITDLLIKAGTPGVVHSAGNNYIEIDFGRGIIIRFQAEVYDERYRLKSEEIVVNNRRYLLVDYYGQHLLVDANFYDLTRTRLDAITAPGKRVD